jgi:hypothetical protein
MKLTAFFVVAASLATSAIAAAQTQPAIDLKNPQAVAALEKDLASDDFPVRERARRLVAQIPMSAHDDLVKLAGAATDPEIKARLEVRVDALEDIRVTDTPPISIDVRNADLFGLAKAYSEALDLPFNVQGRFNLKPDTTWTLKADNLPFSEIFRSLYEQHPLMFVSQFDDIGVRYDNSNWRQCNIFQGVAVCIPDIQPVGATGREVTQMSIVFDPRIPVREVKPIQFAPVTDNAGVTWMVADSSDKSLTANSRLASAGRQIKFQPAAVSTGTALRTIRGAIPIVVQTAAESKDFIPDKDPLNKPFNLGNLQLTMTQCQTHTYGTTIDWASFDLAVRVAPDKERNPGSNGPIKVTIIDAKNQTIAVQTRPQGFTGMFSFTQNLFGTPPVTLRIALTTAVHEVKIPFEFRDVSIGP